MKKIWKELFSMAMAAALLCGCGAPAAQSVPAESGTPENGMTDTVVMEEVCLEDEMIALAETPALPAAMTPVASGMLVKSNSKAVIDYSNTKDGYVMVKYTAASDKRLKAIVKGPTTSYQYNIDVGEWETFPLSDGNGNYTVTLYKNVSGTKYSNELSASFSASLTDQFAPFLRSNQYVDFSAAPNTVKKAEELCRDISGTLDKVKAVYTYVVGNVTYNKALAADVSAGKVTVYLPVLDSVLSSKKGICFDYAALMAGMLRSQGVPCKLVVGNVVSGKSAVCHAWISVWSETTGWIEGVIYFDGTSWQRMDPTFASSGGQSASIMKYIGNGSNYTEKYFY